jgi:hypothetical protein
VRATHYSAGKSTACGLVGMPYVTSDPKKVDCIRCRSTGNFPGKRIKSIMKEAHRMAAANDLGFFHGMKSYDERLRRALIYLGRQR